MRRLRFFFGNPFLDPRISQSDLIAFTTDLIHRLTANNPNRLLDGVIAALSAALSRLLLLSTSDFTMLGIRKGAKYTKNDFRETLPSQIRRIYAVVVAEFDDPSPEMKNIFPKKRSIFARSRDDMLSHHLDTMITGLIRYEAELGPKVVLKATALRDQWIIIHGESESATGRKSATEAERRAARQNLATELFKTIGVLINLFPNDPDRHRLYMQQSLIDGLSRTTDSFPDEYEEVEDDEAVDGETGEFLPTPEPGEDSPPAPVQGADGKVGSTSEQGWFREQTLLPRDTGT